MIITQPKERIAAYVAETQGHNLPWGNYSAIGLITGYQFSAGVIYNNWSEANVCAHIGITGKMTPEFLFAIFDYPFNQSKLRRITGLVPKKNAASRKLCEKLGFNLEGSMRHALPHDDMLVYGMLRKECKWIADDFTARLFTRIQRRALPLAA